MARDKCSCFADSVSDNPELKKQPQGTVKIRYFLLYLACMRENGCYWIDFSELIHWFRPCGGTGLESLAMV